MSQSLVRDAAVQKRVPWFLTAQTTACVRKQNNNNDNNENSLPAILRSGNAITWHTFKHHYLNSFLPQS